jgi:hypothetical protein
MLKNTNKSVDVFDNPHTNKKQGINFTKLLLRDEIYHDSVKTPPDLLIY